MYELTYVGMDGIHWTHPRDLTAQGADELRVYLEERGAHSIEITKKDD